MAKNIRRMLAMVLVMCMFVSALPMQALAAEGDNVVTEGPVVGTTEEGLTTSTTTTTTTSTVDEVQTVVVETATQTSGTTDSGVTVTGSETVTDTTTTQNDGTTQTSTVGSSEETRQSENLGADVPAVEVPVLPNDTVFEGENATKDVVVDIVNPDEVVVNETREDGKVHTTITDHDITTTTTTETVKKTVPDGDEKNGTTTTTDITKVTTETVVDDIYEYGVDGVLKEWNYIQDKDTVVNVTTNVTVTKVNTEIDGDPKESEDDLVYNYTETQTTTKRDVTTNAEITVEDESSFDMNKVIAPENYDGKQYTGDGVTIGSAKKFDGLQNGANPDKKNPGPKPSEEEDPSYKGYDYVLSGEGDSTWAAAPVFMNVVYVKNEDGTPKQDENGNYIIDEEKSELVYAGSKAKYSGMNGTPGQIVLRNEEGEHFYTYCIDKGTGTDNESWYKITNLEDSDYYPDDASAAMLRAIVTNGYWGTDANVYETDENGAVLLDDDGNKITKKDADGNIVVDETVQGSLASIKALMRDTYDENATVTVMDGKGDPHTYTISELIDGLKEHEALAVTQAAIWSYSNGSLAAQNGQDGVICIGVQSAQKYFNRIGQADESALNQYGPTYDLVSDARMKALYDLYLNMEPMESDPEEVSTVINEQNSFKDMSFVVNEKVAENGDKDVYNVDVQFSLDFELDDSHALKIRLTDANGNDILDAEGNVIEKKLAAEGSTAAGNDTLVPVNGVYTLTGLQLSENSDFNFNLKLEGTQELQEGVYVYTSHGGKTHSQTLVGLASGTQQVNVSANVNIKFDVKEAQTVKINHKWSTDPVITPPEEPVTPPTPPAPPAPPAEPAVVDYYEPPAPVARAARAAVWTAPENQRLANEEAVEIPEEPVPLATPAITGDDTGLWVMALMMIACCMVAINVFDKKRSHEAF